MEARQKGKGPVCPNCDQWQDYPSRGGNFYDCYNDCAAHGFAPRVKADIDEGKALVI